MVLAFEFFNPYYTLYYLCMFVTTTFIFMSAFLIILRFGAKQQPDIKNMQKGARRVVACMFSLNLLFLVRSFYDGPMSYKCANE